MLRHLPLLTTIACSWGYGPPFDDRQFESAVLHPDGQRCLYAFDDVVYRPAAGLRAFPDGGIPPYFVRDGTHTLQHEWMAVEEPGLAEKY